ncbi:MAG: 3D domain-containing protein, partial [Pseudomonadota bacterium]
LGGDWSGLLVSQDTGGAIKGSVRGDLYFGTGDRAGSAADTVNATGRLWVLLPTAVAERMRQPDMARASGPRPIVLSP